MLNPLTFTYRIIWNLTLLTSVGLLAHGCNNTTPDSATSPAPVVEKPTTTTAPQTTQAPTATSAQKPIPKKPTETAAAPTTPPASAKPKVSAKGEVSCPKATPVAYFETKSIQISICMGQDKKLFYREVAMSAPSEGRNFPNAKEQGEGNFVAGYENTTYRVNARSLKVTQDSSVLSEQPVTYYKIMSTTNTF
ncbi:MAG: hypothetical protein NT070_20590 [Cyanobacteria bacterium]|nr:hypothetical protein [Cyanobacteriota bacterium]